MISIDSILLSSFACILSANIICFSLSPEATALSYSALKLAELKPYHPALKNAIILCPKFIDRSAKPPIKLYDEKVTVPSTATEYTAFIFDVTLCVY